VTAPKLWLAGHLDVVDGPAPVWTPTQKGGRLYGRGACDMKCAIACYIELLRDIGPALPDYDIGVMITGDEETGGFNSTDVLLKEEGYRGGIVLLPDGGGPWLLEEAAKGMWLFELRAVGKAAHGSRPWAGESAIQTLMSALAELYALAQRFWIDTPEHWHLTYNVGTIQGGNATNSVPDAAVASVDVRSTTEEERVRFEQGVREILGKYPGVTMNEVLNVGSCGISRENDGAQRFIRIAQEKYGITCGWTRNHGASDAPFFAAFDIPVLLILPESGDHHKIHEWVDLGDLDRFCSIVGEWVRELGM
jgi:acetylornithine deacetylase/succinyl-diaminopimelate desuccinylase-like protein